MPAPHQATPNPGSPNEPMDLRASVYQSLIGKGLQPFQAMGVLYSMMGESGGGFNTGAIGDSGRSHGFGQWNAERFANLEKIAAGMGTDWRNPSAQLAHFNAEISGPYAAEIERVRHAANTADATRLWTGSVGEKAGYERPAVNNWQGRVVEGSKSARLDANNAPVFTAGPAVATPAGATPGVAGATPADTRSGYQKFSEAMKSGNVGEALAALNSGEEKDGKEGKGALSKAADAMARPAPASSGGSSPMLAAPPPDMGGQAQAGQALLSQVLEQGAKPLSWSVQPFGYNAGPQVPGTTLNSGY